MEVANKQDDEFEFTPEQIADLIKAVDEIKSGKVKCTPIDEVFKKLDKKYGGKL